MLYDNGPLLGLYADLARATGEAAFARRRAQHRRRLVREMRAPDGAFYASLDADSEGEEGKFYVFTPDQCPCGAERREWAMAAPYFGLDGPPNFEHRHWNLRVVTPLAQVASKLGITLPDAQTRLVGAKAALFMTRAHRVRPGTDDKVLTAWNALVIAGLARAARAQRRAALGRPRVRGDRRAIRATLWRGGRLVRDAARRRAGSSRATSTITPSCSPR